MQVWTFRQLMTRSMSWSKGKLNSWLLVSVIASVWEAQGMEKATFLPSLQSTFCARYPLVISGLHPGLVLGRNMAQRASWVNMVAESVNGTKVLRPTATTGNSTLAVDNDIND